MHRNVKECIGIYSTVQEWSRCNTMQKFGAPNLKKGIRMYQNVLECFGMYWNVLECIGTYSNVQEWSRYTTMQKMGSLD